MLLRSLRAVAAAALMFVLTPAGSAVAAPAKDAAAETKSGSGKKSDAAKTDAGAKKGGAKKTAAKGDAKKTATKKGDAKKDDGKGPASIGAPNAGRLTGAVKLRSSRALKLKERAQTWGLPELVKLLQRAAGKVAKKHARSVMLVGDLSQKKGGAMTGHNSHQTGRDADVGFYVANSKGKPAPMKRFVAFDGAGKSAQVTWAQFDVARNWALVEALLTDKDTKVTYLFVSTPLRLRMLAYAAKKGVAKDLQTQAAKTMMSPRDADVHDDHFHVRIACPESMKGTCVEESNVRSATPALASTKNKDTKGTSAKTDTKTDAKTDAKTDTKTDAKTAEARTAEAKRAVKTAEVRAADAKAASAKKDAAGAGDSSKNGDSDPY